MTVRTAENVIVGGITDGEVAGAARTMVDATLENLRSLTLLILVATVVVVIVAYLWGRPKWVATTTSYVGDAAGRAPDGQTMMRTVRANPPVIERIGLAAIVFVIVWVAIGLEVALLGAALVIGFEVVLRGLSSAPESAADDAASDNRPAAKT